MISKTKREAAVEAILKEVAAADIKHPGGFISQRQALVVLLEEVEEVWEVIRSAGPVSDIKHETCQVAASCLRILRDIWKREVYIDEVSMRICASDAYKPLLTETLLTSYKEAYGWMLTAFDAYRASSGAESRHLHDLIVACLVATSAELPDPT